MNKIRFKLLPVFDISVEPMIKHIMKLPRNLWIRRFEIILENFRNKRITELMERVVYRCSRCSVIFDEIERMVVDYLKDVSLISSHVKTFSDVALAIADNPVGIVGRLKSYIKGTPKVHFSMFNLLIPPRLFTWIFFEKITSCMSHQNIFLLESLLKKCIRPIDVISAFGIVVCFVKINELTNELLAIIDAIPQGTIPLLFLIIVTKYAIYLSVKYIITKRPKYGTHYMYGYSTKEIPIGKILKIKRRLQDFVVADYKGEDIIFHITEVDFIAGQSKNITAKLEKTERILRRILHLYPIS